MSWSRREIGPIPLVSMTQLTDLPEMGVEVTASGVTPGALLRGEGAYAEAETSSSDVRPGWLPV